GLRHHPQHRYPGDPRLAGRVGRMAAGRPRLLRRHRWRWLHLPRRDLHRRRADDPRREPGHGRRGLEPLLRLLLLALLQRDATRVIEASKAPVQQRTGALLCPETRVNWSHAVSRLAPIASDPFDVSIVRTSNSGASRESDVRTSGPRPGLWLTIMTVRNRQEIVEDGPRSIDARRTRTRQCSFGYGRSPASTRRWPHDPVTRTPADVPFMAVPGCVRRIHFGREGPMTLRTRTRHVRSVIPAIALSLAAM